MAEKDFKARMAELASSIETGEAPEGMPPAELLILHVVDQTHLAGAPELAVANPAFAKLLNEQWQLAHVRMERLAAGLQRRRLRGRTLVKRGQANDLGPMMAAEPAAGPDVSVLGEPDAGGAPQRVLVEVAVPVLSAAGSDCGACHNETGFKPSLYTLDQHQKSSFVLQGKHEKLECASCHKPELGFTDGLRVAEGIGGRRGTRNSMSLLNVIYNPSQFWDGRADTLEEQAIQPLVNPLEMGEVEAQPLRRHHRTRLLHVGAEHVAQRHVQQVRGGVVATDRVAAGTVDRERGGHVGGDVDHRHAAPRDLAVPVVDDGRAARPNRAGGLYGDGRQSGDCRRERLLPDFASEHRRPGERHRDNGGQNAHRPQQTREGPPGRLADHLHALSWIKLRISLRLLHLGSLLPLLYLSTQKR